MRHCSARKGGHEGGGGELGGVLNERLQRGRSQLPAVLFTSAEMPEK